MKFDDYEEAARATAIYPEAGTHSFNATSYAVLGLTNEAGEVGGKLKKIWRDQGGVMNHYNAEDIAAELGDVLWYCSALAREIGTTLADVAAMNLEKLASRAERGVIGGSGDTR